MGERRDAGRWTVRLAALASLTAADGLALVLALRESSLVTYAAHNVLLEGGWDAVGGGVVTRAVLDRAARTASAEVRLADGRVGEAVCACPVVWNESVIGALVGVRVARAWIDAEQTLLASAAELVAVELAESNALWRAERTATELETRERARGQLQRDIAAEEDPDRLMDRVTRRVAETFGADGASLMLLEPDGELRVHAAVGLREDLVRSSRRHVGEGIAGWVAKHASPLLLHGKVEDERFTGVDPSIGGALVAPLVAGERVVGVLNVKARAGDRYGQDQLEELRSIGAELGPAIERARLARRMEDDRRQALALYELSRLATFGGAEALDTAAAMLADTLHHDVVGIWTLEPDGARLRLRAGHGYATAGLEISVDADTALRAAIRERRVQRVDEPAVRGDWMGTAARGYVLAPITLGAESLGVFVVGRIAGGYSTDETLFAGSVADYLAGALRPAGTPTPKDDAAEESAASERRRIAQELHDGLAQELTGVVLALEGCQRALERDPEVLPTQLGKAARDARACLAEIRQYMTALRQHDVSAQSLPVTVRRLVDDLRRTSGIAVDLEEVGTERETPPAVERALVRITQEALHNIARHAQAQRAKIVLRYGDEDVELTVEDDGQGFAVDQVLAGAEAHGRFGLLGMKERAEGVGARLAVRSEPGRGTLVQVRIPYAGARPVLNVVPPWPGRAGAGEEVAPQADRLEDEEERRGSGFLQRLFGRG